MTERDVEAVAEADEARRLHRGVDVQAARQVRRLVGDQPDRPPVEAREGDDDVARVLGLDLEQHAVVDDAREQRVHVVGLRRLGRDQRRPAPRRRDRRGRCVGSRGGSSRLFWGRNASSVAQPLEQRRLVGERAVRDARARRARRAPPSSSFVTSSCVTARITSGPVMNMWLDDSTMKTKSVIAGE